MPPRDIRLRVQDRPTRPDWILFGIQYPETYMVFGSTELSYIELEFVSEMHDVTWSAFEPLRHFAPRDQYVVFGGRMATYSIATGDSYGQAIINLFQHWDPDKKAPLGLPEGDTT